MKINLKHFLYKIGKKGGNKGYDKMEDWRVVFQKKVQQKQYIFVTLKK